jgi:phosphatidylserine/phosphatidylglycerophosphate/cardiolipin synthase-like enzyme
VQDVTDVFHMRWSHNLSEGVEYAEHATDFVVARDQAPQNDGLQIQITTTLPEPFWEHSIAETWFNAVAQAQDYIYVEDQYWRLPMVVDAIIQRMQQVPTLRLLVVTLPVNETTDPACAWTHITHQQLLAAFPNRYATYQLKTFDYVIADRLVWNERETEARYDNISVHSKMLIVDDKFMSVGSCNKNNRGVVFEGEMNVAILDPVWVRQQRRRIFANILPATTTATDDVATWWTQFQQAADYNDIVYDSWDQEGFDIDLGDDANPDPLPLSWQPEGFVHTLQFRTLSDCLIENIGPDTF